MKKRYQWLLIASLTAVVILVLAGCAGVAPEAGEKVVIYGLYQDPHILNPLFRMQVAANGDIANWSTGAPGAIPAVGGAMDLVQGVKNIYVITQHTTKTGDPKLVDVCTYPLTGAGVVSRIFTDLAVVDVTDKGFQVVELAPGVTFEEVQEKTGAPILPAA